MTNALSRAIEILLTGDAQLWNIVGVTMRMSLSSSLAALLIGVPFGVLIGSFSFRFKQFIIILNRTLMGLPPVVCGLFCYLLFSGVGPLRHLHLLYTVTGMIIAQVILITPIVVGSVEAYVSSTAPSILETTRGLRLGRLKTLFLIMNESRYQIAASYLMALGRALAEVGAVSMVGGAIAYKTNVMTTAIMNFTNMGSFSTALALGILLLVIALVLNICAHFLQRRFLN